MGKERRRGIVYLYIVARIETGQTYVGITVNARKRWNTHRWLANAGRRSNQLLHRAMAKHGLDTFTFEVVACSRTWAAGAEAERHMIEQFGSHVSRGGYNLTLGGEGPLGRPCSQAARAKIGAANAGRPGRKITDEEKRASKGRMAARRAADPAAFTEWSRLGGEAHQGRKNTDATKKRMSDAALAVWQKRREDHGSNRCVD
jgi:group I intron endonuclease